MSETPPDQIEAPVQPDAVMGDTAMIDDRD
jgi:hypothetical protein